MPRSAPPPSLRRRRWCCLGLHPGFFVKQKLQASPPRARRRSRRPAAPIAQASERPRRCPRQSQYGHRYPPRRCRCRPRGRRAALGRMGLRTARSQACCRRSLRRRAACSTRRPRPLGRVCPSPPARGARRARRPPRMPGGRVAAGACWPPPRRRQGAAAAVERPNPGARPRPLLPHYRPHRQRRQLSSSQKRAEAAPWRCPVTSAKRP